MEKALVCPICDSNDVGYKRDYLFSYEAYNIRYKLYECHNCKLEWWEPLKIIPEVYENEVFQFYEYFHTGLLDELSPHHKPFFKYFPIKEGRLLDIGCGNGIFIKEAEKIGFEVWGIDLDKKSIKVAKEKWRLKNVFNMSLEDFYEYAKQNDLKFDVITFFEVLEHQDNPKRFIEIVKNLLKPGGYIAGSVPNKERLFVRIDRKIYPLDYPPHHFLYLSRNSIQHIFERFGFKEVEFYSVRFDLLRMTSYLEEIVGGKITKKLKDLVKTTLIGKDAQGLNVKYIEKSVETSGRRIFVLKAIKYVRDIIFFPAGLILVVPFNKKGYRLYFQAKKDSANV